MAESDIKVPGVGAIPKKWLWGGAAVVGAVVAWSYWRARSNAPTVIEEGVDGADFPGLDGPGVPGQTGNSSGQFGDPDVIDTVAEWTAAVTPKLEAAGFDPQMIALTIGKWIAGETLTDPEKQLVQAAIAMAGMPPGGPYPIKTALPGNPPPPPPPGNDPPPAQPALPPVGTTVGAPGPDVNVYTWTSNLNAQYPGLGLDLDRLRFLNPGMDKYLSWSGPAGSTKIPTFNPNWSGKNPPLGIPPMRIR